MEFKNAYEDTRMAEAYSKLEFTGTYYLAYRDLPELLSTHARGKDGVDFGCGTGRSTRFLRELDFSAIGVDISEDMIERARALDPSGDYRIVPDGDLGQFDDETFDMAQSIFTYDNIPTMEQKDRILGEIRRVLKKGGIFLNLVSTPDIYIHEWASFTTKDFPANKNAKSGDRVLIINTDIEDGRPVEDIICSDEDYRRAYERAGFAPIVTHHPLGKEEEPFDWVNETSIPPWVIYVLKRNPE